MHLRIYRVYGRPVVAAAVMGIVTKLIYELVYRAGVLVADRPYFVNLIATVAAIVVAIAVYFFVLILIGGLKKNDILQAPKGTKILALLQKIRWI